MALYPRLVVPHLNLRLSAMRAGDVIRKRIVGLGYLALAAWLLVHDLARVTVRQNGLTRYIAVCLLTGFVWLMVGGWLSIGYAGYTAGPIYDAKLHAVFVGFVFSMVFGHAPIIFPAVLGSPAELGLPIAYRGISTSPWSSCIYRWPCAWRAILAAGSPCASGVGCSTPWRFCYFCC